MKSFLSLLSVRREMRASENAILGLGVRSNPGPLAPESFALPCAPLHIHQWKSDPHKSDQCMSDRRMYNMMFVLP